MTTPLAETVATQVRQRRTALGATQAEVAAAASVTVEIIARLERVLRGRASANANPSLETLERIANALGCDALDLLQAGAAPKRTKDELDLVLKTVGPRKHELRRRIAAVVKALVADERLVG